MEKGRSHLHPTARLRLPSVKIVAPPQRDISPRNARVETSGTKEKTKPVPLGPAPSKPAPAGRPASLSLCLRDRRVYRALHLRPPLFCELLQSSPLSVYGGQRIRAFPVFQSCCSAFINGEIDIPLLQYYHSSNSSVRQAKKFVSPAKSMLFFSRF